MHALHLPKKDARTHPPTHPPTYTTHTHTHTRTCYFPDNLASVALLLEKGADPALATHDGRTPLMIAAYAGWVGETGQDRRHAFVCWRGSPTDEDNDNCNHHNRGPAKGGLSSRPNLTPPFPLFPPQNTQHQSTTRPTQTATQPSCGSSSAMPPPPTPRIRTSTSWRCASGSRTSTTRAVRAFHKSNQHVPCLPVRGCECPAASIVIVIDGPRSVDGVVGPLNRRRTPLCDGCVCVDVKICLFPQPIDSIRFGSTCGLTTCVAGRTDTAMHTTGTPLLLAAHGKRWETVAVLLDEGMHVCALLLLFYSVLLCFYT